MYAALQTAGMQPVEGERLNSSVKKGARTSMLDLSVGVGGDQIGLHQREPVECRAAPELLERDAI